MRVHSSPLPALTSHYTFHPAPMEFGVRCFLCLDEPILNVVITDICCVSDDGSIDTLREENLHGESDASMRMEMERKTQITV